MTVGILGAGRMGRALAGALARAGQPVLLASGRSDARGSGWPADGPPPGCRTVTPGQLWRLAPTVLLAVPFPTALQLMSGPVGREGRGRTLVDVTNPGFTPGGEALANPSGGEQVAAAAPSWQVAKAFNTVPAPHLAACHLNGRPVSLPVAGAPAAKQEVYGLARLLGFEPLDAGGLAASRELESLWFVLARISDVHGLHGRVGIHIGAPEQPVRATTPSTAPSTWGG